MAGTRAPFASLAALAAVASAQGEQAGTAAAESAKKDLQSLPTVQRPVEATAGKSFFSGTSAVTGLSLGTPASPGTQKDKDNAVPGKSPNWLLDGVNQLEADAKAQRDAQAGNTSEGNAQLSPTGERLSAATTATANPFTGYLAQWLSPADQALLNTAGRNGSSSSTAPWETPRSDFRRDTSVPAQTGLNPLQMELPGMADFPENRATQNPYLAEALQVESTILASKSGPADGRGAAGALPSILTPSQCSLPPVAPAQAPIEQAKASSSAAPTERLIDDRKYFPQLRRF
jgi:hypothetical protein